MALLNFIKPGTYSVISEMKYFKSERVLKFTLDTHSSIDNRDNLASRRFSFHGYLEVRCLAGENITALPDEKRANVYYYIHPDKSKLSGILVHYPGALVMWDALKQDWTFWGISNNEVFYNETYKKYVAYKDGKFFDTKMDDDIRMWENYFSPEKTLYPNDTSLLQEIYKYLKSLPEFKNCENG